MSHEHPLEDEQTIICAYCDDYASQRRDDFDWEQGVPICAHCMVENDPEVVVGFGFQAAFDRMVEGRDDATPYVPHQPALPRRQAQRHHPRYRVG